MAARALWKGHLKVAELNCAVALYAAATTSERISFHTLNRDTGNRVKREYVDEETGDPVDRDEQVKGYETSKDNYILLDPDEIAETIPQSDKTLSVEGFLECGDVDTVYFDRPYYVTPADDAAETVFEVLREGMREKGVAALARAVLFRKDRTVLLRAQGPGLVANTLHFDYEVRSAAELFEDIPDFKVEGEMLDLAKHIIDTKTGEFDPEEYDDRYDAALAELVKAKMEGREIKKPKKAAEGKVIDLMEALRQSAAGKDKGKSAGKKKTAARSKGKSGAAEQRKAS